MAIKVYINEPIGGLTDQSNRLWYGGQNGFTLIRGQRGTASIVFEMDSADTYKPTVGSPIFIHEIGSVLSPLLDEIVFAGRIQKVERKWIGDEGDHDDTLTCVSLESCFDTIRIDPPISFTGKTGGQIITALYNTYCAGVASPFVAGVPVTLGDIDLTAGGVLPDQVYRQSERISDAFTALATLMGTTIIWGVQMSDQTLYAHATSTVPAPFALDAYLYETGDWIEDETDYRNRQLVQGSFTAWSTSNEMFAGDNVSHSVRLRIPVDRVTTAMLTTGTQATATGIFGTLSPLAVDNPAPGDTFTITPPHSPPLVEDPYTFVTALDNTLRNQILIGATAAETCQNTVDAINANPLLAGITFSLPTWENDACNADPPLIGAGAPTFVLRVKNPGSGGNGVTLQSVHVASPFVGGALVWQGGTASPFTLPQTAGGTDGTTAALQVSVSGANTLSTDVQYTPGSNLITLTAPIPGGTSLSIAYYGLGRDILVVEDTAAVAIRAAAEHGSGKYQQLITDTQNADARAIYIEALSALNNFKVIPESFQFSIFQALLSPGQLLTISITSPTGSPALLDGTWLVQEIQASIVPGVETLDEPYGHFRYQVTVINTNMIATFVDFWQNLAIVTPAGAQTVNNISTISASPSLNPPLPTDTAPDGTPKDTTGTLAPLAAGQQWLQEALGRYAQWRASDLVVDGAVDTRVSSASHPFVAGDVGSDIVIITTAGGFTVGEYSILSLTGTAANLSASPAAVGSTGGVWALVNNSLWCTSYNISPSFAGMPVAIISKNDKALNPFALGAIGPNSPGGGDYALQKGNQVLFATAPDPSIDRLMATYFPAGLTPAPVGPEAATIHVIIDVQATDFPQAYTPHVPPGSDRHFFDVAISPRQSQEVNATISAVGTADLAITWSLIGADNVTTDPAKIGALSASPNGSTHRIYTAPAVLPTAQTPPLATNVVVLGVRSHADSTAQAFDTITLIAAPVVPTHYAAISFFGSTIADQIINSLDGLTWIGVSSPLGTNGGQCVVFGGGQFVAVGQDSGNTTYISITSPDGITWTSHTMVQPSGEITDMVYGGGLYVWADGNNGVIARSSDGISWSSVTFQTPGNNQSWISLAYGAGVYVVLNTTFTTGDPNFAHSSDAITWATSASPTKKQMWAVTFGGGQFVASGGLPSGSSSVSSLIYTSPDGITWTQQTTPANNAWTGVAYGNGIYVAVATNRNTITSPDGITWTLHATAVPGGTLPSHKGVRFLNGLFYLTRNTTGNAIVTSSDGVTWTALTTPQNDIYDVAFG